MIAFRNPLVTNALFVYFGCCLHFINIQHATHDGLKRASAVNSNTELIQFKVNFLHAATSILRNKPLTVIEKAMFYHEFNVIV